LGLSGQRRSDLGPLLEEKVWVNCESPKHSYPATRTILSHYSVFNKSTISSSSLSTMPLLPQALLQPLRSRSSTDREGLHGSGDGGTRVEPSRRYATLVGAADRAMASVGLPGGGADSEGRRKEDDLDVSSGRATCG
jgi:hypothetical protein